MTTAKSISVITKNVKEYATRHASNGGCSTNDLNNNCLSDLKLESKNCDIYLLQFNAIISEKKSYKKIRERTVCVLAVEN